MLDYHELALGALYFIGGGCIGILLVLVAAVVTDVLTAVETPKDKQEK